MSVQQTVEINSVETVLRELAPLIDEVQRTLESRLESGDAASGAEEVTQRLTEIRGTLQLLDLDGPSMLVDEMRVLAMELYLGRVEAVDAAMEALLKAVFKLPDYLDRIQGGRRDRPAVLLPMLNELRAARGAEPLDERAVFKPRIEARAGAADAPETPDLQPTARRLRPRFQKALLGWYRGNDIERRLGELGAVLTELAEATGSRDTQRLWSVCGALTESLADQGLEADVNVKILMAKVERLLSQLVRDGERALEQTIPLDLLRNLLYYVARSGSDSPRVRAVKDTYHLDELLPDSETQADFEGPNRGLLEVVGEGIRDDLARIRDAVEIYVHSDERRPDVLEGLPARMKQVSDTFSMLGLGDAHDELQACADTLDGLDQLGPDEATARMQALADVVLRVDSELTDLERGRPRRSAGGADDAALGIRQLPDGEYRPLLSAVVAASLDDLSRIREAVSAYCDDPDAGQEAVAEVPALLDEVRGAVAMLPLDAALPLIAGLQDYVQDEFVRDERRPDASTQMLLADVVAGLEYYLEAVDHDRAGMTHLLESATRAMNALQSGEAPRMYAGDEQVVLSSPAGSEDFARPGDSERDDGGAPVETDDGGAVDLDDLGIDLDETGTPPGRAADETGATGHEGGGPDAEGETPETGELDVGIELNDFDEPVAGDAGDAAAGSGAEEAAAEPGAAAPPAEESAESAAVAGEAEPETAASVDQAAAAAAQEPPDAAAGADREPSAQSDGPRVDPAASGSQLAILGEDVDDEIVDVFIEEALGELDKINEGLPAWKANTGDEESLIIIRRAYHTLKGGGRLIGAELIGEFSWAMENLLNRVIDHSIQPSRPVFDTLDEASAVLPELIEQIRGNRAPIDGIDDLIERAHALSRGEDGPPPPSGGGGGPAGGSPSEGPLGGGSDGGARAAATSGGSAEASADAPAPDSRPDEAAATAPADELATAASADDTLLRIFANEAETHQQVLRRALEAGATAGGSVELTEDIRRALHTLVGSAQTAGCDTIAELAEAMEEIVKMRRDTAARLTVDEAALFREAIATVDRMLAALPDEASIDASTVHGRLEEVRKQAENEAAAAYDEGESELLDIFLEEADELLEACDRTVARWQDDPVDPDAISDLQRSLHTLKGGARMANFPPIADLTHEVESLVNAVAEGACAADADLFELLQEAVDALTVLMEQARGRQAVTRVDWLIEDLRNLRGRAEDGTEPASAAAAGADHADPAPAAEDAEPRGPEPEPEPESSAAPERAAGADTGADPSEDGGGDAAATKADAQQEPARAEEGRSPARKAGAPSQSQAGSDQIRVQSELLDNLVNFAGEVSIYHSRLGEQMGQYRFNLNEFEQTVSRLRDQLRVMENETESQILHRHEKASGDAEIRREDFDPLEFDRYTRIQELSRSLAESVGDLDSIKEILENLTRDAETLLLQQSRVSSELQDGLMQTRMVRFDGLRARLSRIVRQTAGQLGKKAQITMSGGEIEVDRSIQERIVAPLEHILRNAVSHGIESTDERRKAGKPEQGTIRLDLHRGGTDIVIDITDDGRGIDPDSVRRKGIERGLINADDAPDDNEVIKLILETGFSTANEVTQISGRGVGMDVVDAEIRRLGGTLGIHTQKGAGTRFTVRLPVTLAINQAVLVEAGEDTYAIPIASIEGVAQVTAGELKDHYLDTSKSYEYAGNEYGVQHLGSLLGTSEPRLDDPAISYPVIMIRAGDERVALHVDQLVGRREVVVKPLGAPLNMLPGISGATIMADGEVVLILDIGGLLRTDSRFVAASGFAEGEAASAEQEGADEEAAPTVLVVDDSITIRKVTQRILARNGINVATAKDGVDAVSWMAHTVPDLILLDIEMPRMDGYEVATYVKGDERLAEVPIIMITSRTGEKHRQRAEDIGVAHYLGKPYQEGELMEHINALIGTREAA